MFLPPVEFVRSPEALGRVWSPDEARAYTRWLATHHYENFHVVSFLLPKRLHQDFYNVYAYCRWADDLGDEIGDRAESLRLLEWWRGELEAMYQGRATHPGFRGARGHGAAPRRFRGSRSRDLIQAFVQDQTVTRYRDWDELFDYCRCSANPVGRLVLYLVRLLRRGAADALRRHLHGAATRQFLAGRDRRPAQGPRLHSARCAGAARLPHRGSVRAPLHARLSRGDARNGGEGARIVPGGACR